MNSHKTTKIPFIPWLLRISLVSVGFLGCTHSILQTADTLPKKEIAGGIGSAVSINGDGHIGVCPMTYLRCGLTDNVEMGTRDISGVSYITDVKYRLVKEPVTFSLGVGSGFVIDGPYILEGTVYLSKKSSACDFYIGYRINSYRGIDKIFREIFPKGEFPVSFNFNLIAFGLKLSCTPWLDLMGEINSDLLYPSLSLNAGVDLHRSKK